MTQTNYKIKETYLSAWYKSIEGKQKTVAKIQIRQETGNAASAAYIQQWVTCQAETKNPIFTKAISTVTGIEEAKLFEYVPCED
ncbi:MAG: hypothetical protein R3Y26_12195 [Rikenellaceae bacterium]